MRAKLVLAKAILLPLLASALPAAAHDDTFPIPGDSISIEVPAPASAAFSFSSTGGEVTLVDHDPRTDGAGVLVRSVVAGADAGRTPFIALDQTLWTTLADGFQYTDGAGTRGGITSVTLRSGALSVAGSGPTWPWSPGGSQDTVWFHFRIGDTGYCARFDAADASSNTSGSFVASGAAAPGACPAQVCGDGLVQPGEACDDGNLLSGDGCEATCEIGACNAESYDSTFEAIQDVVFEGYSCAIGACHDPVEPKNGLELTPAAAWESLMGPLGAGAFSQDYPDLKLVEPGEPDLSYLYVKLAAKTLPGQAFVVDPGVGMPSGSATALTQDHLEAVRKWIRGGAPQTGIVEGTQALLGTCLPPPTPLKIPVPAVPAAGVQLRQTPWPLPPTDENEIGEDEICMATYYDVSSAVPAEEQVDCPPQFQPSATSNVTNPSGKCFRWNRQTLYQDPQSHHAIIHVYTGQYPTTHDGWGSWTYKLEPTDPEYATKNGDACDPLAVEPATGQNPGCSGAVVTSVACVGYGPPDASQFGNITGGGGGNLPTFSISQEPFYDQSLAAGVYDTLPISGIVVWNSHAFNLTPTPSTMAQYLNLALAEPDEQRYPLEDIFHARWIFAQDTLPFTTEEICATYTIPQHARLFQLSSHTHLRGTRWRTWAPPNTPCQPECPRPHLGALVPSIGCRPDPSLPICTGPRPDAPIYTSTDYSDPLQLDFDPPIPYHGEDDEDRTFLFCSRYDNGSTPDSPHVKRRSQTPMPPGLPGVPGVFDFPIPPEFANAQGIGGPCPVEWTHCVDGDNQGLLCAGDHSVCGDPANEWCDACPARGGVTTEDEMFILLGSYYIPEPGTAALGGAAVGALALLGRRRPRRGSRFPLTPH